MSFDYHTFVDGKGYRFTLPSLGLPDPAGQWVLVHGAVTTNQTDTLAALSKTSSNTQSAMRYPPGDCVTIDVTHEGALWVLPLLDLKGSTDCETFTVKVRRVAPPRDDDDQDGNLAATFTRLNTSYSATSSQLTESRSLSPTASVSDASLCALSLDDTVSVASTVQTLATSDDEEDSDWSSTSDSGSDSEGDPEDYEDRTCACCAETIAPMRSNYRYNSKIQWGLELRGLITRTEYVDKLPARLPFSTRLLRKIHGDRDPTWTVDNDAGILYHLTTMQPQVRSMLWLALTKPNVGYPCAVAPGGVVSVDLGIQQDVRFKLPSPKLAPGPALLKVEPITGNYNCQPTAASPEVSFFLNNFKLIIEQGTLRLPACEPLAEYVLLHEEILLGLLGQCASAEKACPGKQMMFCVHAPPIPGAKEGYNVGVRLRDGGARFPILQRARGRKRIAMPGSCFLQSMHGDLSLIARMKDPSFDRNQIREVPLRMAVPEGQQDIVYKVEDAADGYYSVLKYAFRPVGVLTRIEEDEYREVEVHHMDQWSVEFLLNMARTSVGIGEQARFE